jgi:hypothetical protein
LLVRLFARYGSSLDSDPATTPPYRDRTGYGVEFFVLPVSVISSGIRVEPGARGNHRRRRRR